MPASSVPVFRSLASLTETHPQRLFWWFAGLHLVLWTLLATWACPNAPLDVIEGYAWGREWLWGTYKHPPMQAWILEIFALLTGRAPWAHFLASQIAVVAAFWAVWQTGRRILGETRGLIGVLLLEGVVYYNITSPEFNPNVLQLAFWALAGMSFYRGVKDDRLMDWVLLGVWSAAGLCTKYSTVLLLGIFAVLILQRPEARRCLKKPGPYIAMLVGFALFLPHLGWLWRHDFLPFTYVKERLQAVGPATRYLTPPDFFPTFLLSPLVFIVGQILALLPAMLLFLVLDDRPEPLRGAKAPDNFDRAFLTATTFVPMLITLMMAISLGYKIHDMWGAPFFNFAGLWALMVFYPQGIQIRPRFVVAWSLVVFAGLLAFGGNNLLMPYVNLKASRIVFPGSALGRQVSEAWHKRYAAPLAYVIGDTWAAGNVAYYAPDRPHLFINADRSISPWVKSNQPQESGGVIVWCQEHCAREQTVPINEKEPAFLKEQFPNAEIQEPLVLPRQTGAELFPVTIGWAILPPTDIVR